MYQHERRKLLKDPEIQAKIVFKDTFKKTVKKQVGKRNLCAKFG